MRLWSESLKWLGHGRQERGFKYAYRSSCLTFFFHRGFMLCYLSSVSRTFLRLFLLPLIGSLTVFLD